MGIIDIVIVAAVLAAIGVCVRSALRGGPGCDGCSLHCHGRGGCPAADRMIADAELALDGDRDRRETASSRRPA